MNTEFLLQRRFRLLGRGTPLFYQQPLHLVRGSGVWLYDADGNRYLDAYNNVPVVGHCHPKVVAALSEQAARLNTHTRYLHNHILDYAERLTATFAPSLSMAMFACTGSEANEIALRMARHCTGGMGMIVTDSAYHGNTTAVAELGTAFMPEAARTRHVRSIPAPDSYRALSGLQGEALADAYADRVADAIAAFEADGIRLAGMLLCPEFANEGLLNAPPGFMAKAVEKVRAAGGLFIADEVQGGFGRTGRHMWSHQWYDGLVPDIVTMGKPMGNGHPVSGVVARADLIEEFGRVARYFNTFGGNPVSCAVGMSVLDVLEEEALLDNATRVGAYLAAGLCELQQHHELIGEVRQKGLFLAVELVGDRASRAPVPEKTLQVINWLREHGVLISKTGPHGTVLKIRPPLPFATGHADLLLDKLDQALVKVLS